MLDLGWALTPIPSVLTGIGEDPQRHRKKAMRGWRQSDTVTGQGCQEPLEARKRHGRGPSSESPAESRPADT